MLGNQREILNNLPNHTRASEAKRVRSEIPNVQREVEWDSVLNKLQHGISVHSPAGEIEWANQRLCELYDKPLSELRGLTAREAFCEDLSYYERAGSLNAKDPLQFETEVSGKSFLVTIEPVIDDRNRITGFVRTAREVTAERSAMTQLEEAARLASLGQMLFGIAHSVGTPLNIISGYAEFLLMRTGANDAGRKELSAILDQTRRIATLFSEALDMARLPTGQPTSIDLKTLLMSTIELASHHLRKADVKAEVTCVKPPPLIYGEVPQLKQAFFNLIVNAANEIGTGGRIEVVLDQARKKLSFATVAVQGTDAGGTGHDFSRLLAWLSNPLPLNSSPALGLLLVRQIMESSGAEITAGTLSKRGVPILIHLPTGRSAGTTDPEGANSENDESADSHR